MRTHWGPLDVRQLLVGMVGSVFVALAAIKAAHMLGMLGCS